MEKILSFDGYEPVREYIQVADHDDKTGAGVVVHGKGNMCKPSDSDSHGEERWVSWDSWMGWDKIEDSCRMGRPDGSNDRRKRESKGGSTEESGSEEHISGKVQEPGRTGKDGRGCVEGICEGVDLTACGRLASNQLVHACAGIPVPFSKVPGQGCQTGNFIKQATLEQGDLEDWLSTDRGACVGVIDPEPGLRQPPCVSTILSKTLPFKTLPKPKTGRWRRAIPA